MGKFEIAREKIEDILRKAQSPIEYSHSQSVLKWVLKLKPDADICLKVSALGHDIDRSIPQKRVSAEDFENYEEFKREHSRLSAEIISDIIKDIGFSNEEIKRTRYLIENHEIGGDNDVDILRDADSISFFENNLLSYAITHKEYLESKIKFMYQRLSDKAKLIVSELKFKDKSIEEIIKRIISEI